MVLALKYFIRTNVISFILPIIFIHPPLNQQTIMLWMSPWNLAAIRLSKLSQYWVICFNNICPSRSNTYTTYADLDTHRCIIVLLTWLESAAIRLNNLIICTDSMHQPHSQIIKLLQYAKSRSMCYWLIHYIKGTTGVMDVPLETNKYKNKLHIHILDFCFFGGIVFGYARKASLPY